ncbi:hypothetical protein EAI_16867 [Harpegnathos saltator]|uniref:Uncharacterized protein n=1 Tax=Harpegnathos saltator TaxID=610380 RepID=E2BP33_HARSA|nr:hypothetical protein EAI_16867 [Harpegnathos saltator]
MIRPDYSPTCESGFSNPREIQSPTGYVAKLTERKASRHITATGVTHSDRKIAAHYTAVSR